MRAVITCAVVALAVAFAQTAAVGQRRAASSRSATGTTNDVAALLREAAELLQAGRIDEAEPLVRRAVAVAPQTADAHNLLGAILDQRGRTEDAEREYREALRLNPRSISARANLGVLLARTNRSDQAIQMFESVLTELPDHPQAVMNLGLLYAARGDYNRALPLLERANTLFPNTFAVLYNLGVVLCHLKRFDEATGALAAAATLSPDDSGTFYYLGLIASSRGDSEAAAQFWLKALSLRPDFAEANFMLGEELRKRGQPDRAREYYERALAQDATKLVYYVRLGGVYLLLGDNAKALETFQRGAEKFPNVAEAHYFVALAARGREDYELAESELRKTLAIEPDNVDALAQLGFILGEHAHYEEAEQLLQRAMRLSNNRHFVAIYDMGRLLVKTQRYEEAIPILLRGTMLNTRFPGIHYQLFLAYSRLKRRAEASQELEIFKRLDEERKRRRRSDYSTEDFETDESTQASPSPTP
ncbi:MAG TPA: tetratricopeptide repeat protein [Pyrinomonadaceae bacterium]|nr:tetratricopeptide repeat protein [Pyrinomonadaceae bacterium]